MGGYVAQRIGVLTDADLVALEAIMDLADPLLADWLTGRVGIPDQPFVDVLRAMRDAAVASAAGPCRA